MRSCTCSDAPNYTSLNHIIVYVLTPTQDPFLGGRDLTTYIGGMSTKPGTAGPSNSFSKWQKGGVS